VRVGGDDSEDDDSRDEEGHVESNVGADAEEARLRTNEAGYIAVGSESDEILRVIGNTYCAM